MPSPLLGTPTPPALVLPSYDNSAISAGQTATASGTPFTWSSGGGTQSAWGIVFLDSFYQSGVPNGNSLAAVADVEWGGVAMIDLGGFTDTNNATAGWGRVFVLPSVLAGGAGIPGGSQTVSVTLTEAGKSFRGYASSYSYNNVAGMGPLYGNGTTGVLPSITVPVTNPASILWCAVQDAGPTGGVPSSPSFTQRKIMTTQPCFIAGDISGVTGGATSVFATLSSSQASMVCALELKAGG